MSAAPLNDPTAVASINATAREWAAADGDPPIRPIAIDLVAIADDIRPLLSEVVRDRVRGGGVLIVTDRTPKLRGGEDVTRWVAEALAAIAPTQVLEWPAAGGPLHADEPTAAALVPHLSAAGVVVALGSGSLTDVVKQARHLAPRRLPLVAVPTAASVTAYTSSLAVLTVHGVKRTRPTTAPDAVLCDLGILRDAPLDLARAGFADVLARGVSGGDWFLAHGLGMTPRFSRIPMRLLDPHEQVLLARPQAALQDELRTLVEAVLLAGMAMTLVDQTAPLSGWEHVISHYLDLHAGLTGTAAALHGAQVGVGTLIAARAYDEVLREPVWWERLSESVPQSDWHQAIDDHFGRWDPSGAVCAELHADIDRKLASWSRACEGLSEDNLEVLRDRTAALVREPAVLEAALAAVGAPRTFAALQPPTSARIGRDAVLHAHLLRERFTLGDALVLSGFLTPERIDRLLHRADV